MRSEITVSLATCVLLYQIAPGDRPRKASQAGVHMHISGPYYPSQMPQMCPHKAALNDLRISYPTVLSALSAREILSL